MVSADNHSLIELHEELKESESNSAKILSLIGKARLAVLGLGEDVVTDLGYFLRNRTPQADVVQGLLCESKITVLGGDYGVGKSPLIADLVLHIVNGMGWCGRKVEKRPVIHFDFETPAQKYKRDLERGAARLGVALPCVPDVLEPFFWNDDTTEPSTARLIQTSDSVEESLVLVRESLRKKPNAVVIFDPIEMFARVNKREAVEVVQLYKQFRRLFAEYPQAAILCTFNLKKEDKKTPKPNLLADARGWLEEVSGAKEIMSRSDIRLGIDFFDDEQIIRVINGVQRGEPFNPLLIQPAGDPEAGFDLCTPDHFSLRDVLSSKQLSYWYSLPERFTYKQARALGVPNSSLGRLIERAKSVGLLHKDGEAWVKVRYTRAPENVGVAS